MITVGVATYKGKDRIGQTIKSVVQQSYPNYEFKIVEDGSKYDKSIGYFAQFPKDKKCDVYYNPENRGIPFCYNKLVKSAGYGITLLLDDDVIVPFELLEAILFFFNANADVGCVGFKSISVDYSQFNTLNSRYPLYSETTNIIPPEPATELAGYCLAFRTHLAQKFQFSENYRIYRADSDFCCRLAHLGYWSYRLHYPFVWHMEHTALKENAELDREEAIKSDTLTFIETWGNHSSGIEYSFLQHRDPREIRWMGPEGIRRNRI